MKLLIFISALFAITGVTAQVNLVPNPGFEIYDTCPSAISQIARAVPWFYPTKGTTDFFHACSSSSLAGVPTNFAGNSPAHSGNGIAGIYVTGKPYNPVPYSYREYLAVKLNSPLIANQRYYVSFYAMLAYQYSDFASDQMSMFFSKTPIYKNAEDEISALPQIQNPAGNFITSFTSWAKISGSFVADGGEQYAYIGNFHPTVTNDTVYVNGRQISGNRIPLASIYYYVDDVCVSTSAQYCSVSTGYREYDVSESVKVYPSPTSGHLTITMDRFNEPGAVTVKNAQGVVVKQLYTVTSSIDLNPLADGIYFITLEAGGYRINKRVVIQN